MDDLIRNLRYALRQLTRRPGFAAVVVLTLALGIGANTAIFSVVDGVLLQPLPYDDPDELVILWGDEGGIGTGSSGTSYPDLVDFQDQAASFETLAAWNDETYTLTGYGGEPVRVPLTRVTWDLFPMLGVAPAMGRGFTESEDRLGAPDVAVLTYAFWRDRLGASPEAIGSTLTADGRAFEVVGVMPEGFQWSRGEIYAPLVARWGEDFRGNHRLVPIGRLAAGVSIEEADAEVKAIAARLERMYPEDNTDRSAYLEPYRDTVVGSIRPTLWAVFGMVGLVLLIACANVANILLTRATERGQEVALRTALGAGRGDIARQLVTESLILTGLGGALGLGVAATGLELLRSTAPPGIPRLANVGLDAGVLFFALAITVATGLVFGLLPSLQAARRDLHLKLKEGGRDGGRGRGRLSQVVVVGEVALAMVAIVAAGLLVNSFVRLQAVDPGFEAESVLVVPISLPDDTYAAPDDPTATRAIAFYEEVERRVGALPGVESVASAYMHPLEGGWESSFSIPGVFDPPEGQRPEARLRPITPGYFSTVGLSLLEGRDITDRDAAAAPGVVVVNESFEKTFFPDGDALGYTVRRAQWWEGLPFEYEIIGVVGDVKMDGLDAEVPMAMYFSQPQFPFTAMNLVVATSVPPRSVLPAVQDIIWDVDAELPIENVQTLAELSSGSVASERFRTALVSLFAALALALSAIGIYGVLSYNVARRTRELGLRMSLGARTTDVLRLVVRQGMTLTGIGLLAGVLLSLVATNALATLLFEVSPTDLATFAIVAAVLGAVALVACLLPATRATRVDPMVALRND
ncbi:MAG: ABC transporter permease [Gemmatimonadetes bacterium]|nr:ABC transporter permease [Gemmatimonadota bacterium]